MRRPAPRAPAASSTDGGVLVPLFGRPHLVTHPGGEVTADGRPAGGPAGRRPASRPTSPSPSCCCTTCCSPTALRRPATWSAYRELPDGLFYAASFAGRAEAPLARAFAGSPAGLDAFRAAARAAGGDALTLGDASFRFVALPRVDVAVLVWAGDDEEPGEARVLFDANAGHYLPAEDLAGLGGQLAHRLAAAARP